MFDNETKEAILLILEEYMGRLPTSREDWFCSEEFSGQQAKVAIDEILYSFDAYPDEEGDE